MIDAITLLSGRIIMLFVSVAIVIFSERFGISVLYHRTNNLDSGLLLFFTFNCIN